MLEACDLLGLSARGEYKLACVGESHYQDAFERICGTRTGEGESRVVIAVLSLEDTNPYDPGAVRVEVDGMLVGYLSRPDARAYRELLSPMEWPDPLQCKGVIRGGWERTPRDRGHYGIWLDLPIYDV